MNHNTDPYSTSSQVNLLANKIAEVVEQHVYDRTSELRQIENALLSLPFIQRELKKMLDLKNENNYSSQTSGSENGDSDIKAVSMKVRTLESSDVENFSLESNSENNYTEISKLPENDLDFENGNYDYMNDKVDNIIFTINNLQNEDNLDEDNREDQENVIIDENIIGDEKVDEDQHEEESEGEIDGEEDVNKDEVDEDEDEEDEEEEEVEDVGEEVKVHFEDKVEKEVDEVVKEKDEEEDEEDHQEEDEEEELIEVTIKGNTYFVDSLDNGIIYKIDLQEGEEVFIDVGKVKRGKFILNLNNEIF
tara:strand:- start:24 stop:941 length:918 start_codon:yes stop_codon:yes gene_type:complete